MTTSTLSADALATAAWHLRERAATCEAIAKTARAAKAADAKDLTAAAKIARATAVAAGVEAKAAKAAEDARSAALIAWSTSDVDDERITRSTMRRSGCHCGHCMTCIGE